MKKIISLAIAVVLIASCSKEPKLNYSILGQTNDNLLNGKNIIMEESREGKNYMSDTLNIEKNAFQYEGETDTIAIKFLYFKDSDIVQPFQIVTEEGKITVTIDGKFARIGGTPLNDKLQVRKDFERKHLEKVMELVSVHDSKAAKKEEITPEEASQYETKLRELAKEYTNHMIAFAKENGDNILCDYCFAQYYYMLSAEKQQEMMSFAPARIKKIYYPTK